MARLEYRLLDEQKGFPVLYFYAGIDKSEIAMRFACDYLVKDRTVYEKTSCAIEDDCHVIYVKVSEEEKTVDSSLHPLAHRAGIRLEVREFLEDTAHYPLIHTYEWKDHNDVVLHLTGNYFYHQGCEWEKTSTEVDEDRRVYVLYAQKTA